MVMPGWLRKKRSQLSEYRWYRKWYGGSWTLWRPMISCADCWFPSDYHPGCVFPESLATENYGAIQKHTRDPSLS